LNPTQDRYVVIGNPIEHSKSPAIHTQFALQTQQALAYERLLVALDGFDAAIKNLIASGVRGANITLPFKLDAYNIATDLTPRARAAGAVNTLKFEGDKILGDNTDGIGLVRDIVVNAGVSLQGSRILLLGAGGAARGVILPLLSELPAELVIANRTVQKAQDLLTQFHGHLVALSASSFVDLSGEFDVVINATSASLSDSLPNISSSLFNEQSFIYDMMYGAKPTPFMQWAAEKKASVRDGLGMLVEQAAESFELWRGVRPDTTPVYALLRSQLTHS
jgi:shikimate dehydrogenase